MAFSDLQDFIKYLENKGELIRVKKPVSTVLEMTEIHTRLLSQKGPAVLFEKPINSSGKQVDIPVLINLFGTIERVAMGINKKSDELSELGRTLAFLRQPQPPEGWKETINMFPLLKTVLNMKPSKVKNAKCQNIVFEGDDVDLTKLPIQTCWPNEPAPLFTWPLVITKDENEKYNLGIYRMQLLNKNTVIMRWLRHRGGAQNFLNWKKKNPNEPMPIAVSIGTDPATLVAAVTPTPESLSEYQFAGFLRNKKLELVKAKNIPLFIPANSEIVLEGHILPNELADEGPYGDHTGYYNSVEKFPIFKVNTITMKEKPIYLSTFTGRPPDEPSILGEALNEVFIPLIQQQFPEITDFWLPPEACSYRIAVVSINKDFPGQAKRIMMGIWSYLKQFMYTKWIIVVDQDINVREWKDVVWAISTRMDPSRDITIIENTPIDYLDFASTDDGLGSKIGLDATNKIAPETNRIWGSKIKMEQNIIELIDTKWDKLGLPGIGKSIWK
ncbi:MAG: 3-octaprenyl-4-hydroxybenzoate carboxy-lyase [Alphaproteobacteria bacterium MarineAlpha2_Bin1]|nr:MAG: 3-octaprenyl-4-hydroxybenzoate carboxy-lyase [Alphaproteobacteria bacterium MarineAlpha2_Bin1]